MVHQFDDVVYAQCLPQHQQLAAHHCQQLPVARHCSTGPSRTSVGDYVMYTGNGNTAGCDSRAAERALTSMCYRRRDTTCGVDAAATNQRHPPLSLQQQQQQTVCHMDFKRHHQARASECVGVGPEDSDQSGPCWAYPSTGDADCVEGLFSRWSTSVGLTYSGYTRRDDSLDVSHYQLQDPDRTALSIYHDGPAQTAVTTATNYRLQPSPNAVVKQHLMDVESRPHHGAPAGSAWTEFSWMKKQTFSPVTPTGTRVHALLFGN